MSARILAAVETARKAERRCARGENGMVVDWTRVGPGRLLQGDRGGRAAGHAREALVWRGLWYRAPVSPLMKPRLERIPEGAR